MSLHQFSEVYKTWSDLDLFRLLQNKGDYQQEAVEAADAEMNSRKLSESELETLVKKYQEEESKKQNTPGKKFARAIETNKEKLIDDFNPFSENTTNRHIRLLCYAVALIVLYNFTRDYRSIRSILTYGEYFNSSTILLLMPYLFMPIGIFYFWKRQKFGWSIFSIWLVLLIAIVIASYLWELRAANDKYLGRFFPRQGLSYYLPLLLIFGGLLIYINTKRITDVFNIDKKFQLKIGIVAIFYALFSLTITLF